MQPLPKQTCSIEFLSHTHMSFALLSIFLVFFLPLSASLWSRARGYCSPCSGERALPFRRGYSQLRRKDAAGLPKSRVSLAMKGLFEFFRTFETFLQILTQLDFLQITSPQSSCQELTLFSRFWVYESQPRCFNDWIAGQKISYYKRGGLVYSLHVVDREMVKCCHSIWGFTKVEWTAWRTHHEHLVPSLKPR